MRAKGAAAKLRLGASGESSRGRGGRREPNSALVWDYLARDADADGTIDFEERMHRTVSSPVIAAGLLLIPDFSGLVHCLDACTGEVCWTHDILSETWASPLAADGRVYISDQEGKITILKLSRTKKVLTEIEMQQESTASPSPPAACCMWRRSRTCSRSAPASRRGALRLSDQSRTIRPTPESRAAHRHARRSAGAQCRCDKS